MDNPLTTMQKLAIAKTLGYSETAFISKSTIADYKFEYFTPEAEVDLCGHATVGAFLIMKQLNLLTKNHYTIDTKSGVLEVNLENDTVFMQQTQPEFSDILPISALNNCFNTANIDTYFPVQIVSTGLKDILIPIQNIEKLHNLQPNFDHIKKISEKYNVIGMHLFASDNDRIVCRNFAPLYDINEEAATGTSNGALACYLHQKHNIQKDLYVFEQGYSLDSPSEILVKLATNNDNEIEKVYVGGKGYYCETKVLDL